MDEELEDVSNALAALVANAEFSPFRRLEATDLGELQGECAEEGNHNPSYRVTDGGSRPPSWIRPLQRKLRRKHGRSSVGKAVCHVAECDGCMARVFRYGVTVRLYLGDGLVLEREYGEPQCETSMEAE